MSQNEIEDIFYDIIKSQAYKYDFYEDLEKNLLHTLQEVLDDFKYDIQTSW